MENKITNYCIRIFFVAMLFGSVACETEPLLDADQNGLNLSTSAIDGKKDRSSVAFDLTQECNVFDKTDLYAGQHILVGDVTVVVNGENYEITYNITNNGYCITETHLSVVESPDKFPMSGGGNPKNGHFEYGDDNLDCVSSITYVVPRDKGTYIAAHAVVNCKSTQDSESLANVKLPEELVTVCIAPKGTNTGDDSYFDVTINESSLAGEYGGWCVDYDMSISALCLDFEAYSSYDENLPGGVIDIPENLGAVNWLLNQGFIGTESVGGFGNYTLGDIQLTIWKLLEDNSSPSPTTEPYNADRVQELTDMALQQTDFVPGCDELMVVVLIPSPLESQSMIITIPVPCDEGDCEETAWADGCDFPGNNWATYFHFLYGS
ncbi:hypothetical protein WJN01_12425 [Flavobacteriaceae bacterium SZ-1-7]|uniref:hypothetical protein n=1 Tax=Tamlana sedimenti TaxID=3134126 RepID=UPI003125D062